MSVIRGDKATSPLTGYEDDTQDETTTSKVVISKDNTYSVWKSFSLHIKQNICCPGACYSKLCTYAIYLSLATMFLGGVILLICFGVFLVAPYRQSLRYVPTTCRVQFSNYTHTQHECFCGDGCIAYYRCLIIYGYHDVFDEVTETMKERVHTILYDTQKDMETQLVCICIGKCHKPHY